MVNHPAKTMIYVRDEWTCWLCGQHVTLNRTPRASCDHILPVWKGGLNTHDNLLTACRRCNNARGSGAFAENKQWRGFRETLPQTRIWLLHDTTIRLLVALREWSVSLNLVSHGDGHINMQQILAPFESLEARMDNMAPRDLRPLAISAIDALNKISGAYETFYRKTDRIAAIQRMALSRPLPDNSYFYLKRKPLMAAIGERVG